MITDLIVSAVLGAINALLSLVPSFSLPGMEDAGGQQFGQYLTLWDRIFPVSTMLQIISLVFVLKLAFWGWDFVVFIYHQFWGSD